MKYDAIIVGGGVLGLSLAYHLSVQGMHVVLFEREPLPGMHASGRNAGMIRQLYRHEQLTDWARRSIALWPEPIRDKCFQKTGSIIAGRVSPDHHPDLFETREVRSRSQPGNAVPAVFTAGDGLLDSPAYMQALFSLCDKRKAEFHLRTRISAAQLNNSVWNVCTEDGVHCSAPRLINCCGAWANEMLGGELSHFGIKLLAYVRHLFLIDGWPIDYMPAADCGFYWHEADRWYLRRWDQSTRLVSICDEQPADPDNYVPTSSIDERVSEILLDALPEAAASTRIVRSWHCFRTYADDQLPVWGEDPDLPGLFWLAGFGGFGMSTSFAATFDACAHLCGENVKVPAEFSAVRLKQSTFQSRLGTLL